MKRFLLFVALMLGLYAPTLHQAAAQSPCGVNFNPQVGVNCANVRVNTYAAISVGLVPAASGTDIFCIDGSTSKNIHVRRFIVGGTAGTTITTPVILKLNHSLDTGGTSPTGLALPVAAPLNQNNPASTATLVSYTANPTIPDSSPSYLSVIVLNFPTTTSAGASATVFYAGTLVDAYNQGWDIPKAATVTNQLCLNLNAVSISSGALTIEAVWTED